MAEVLLFRPIYDPFTRSTPTFPWGLVYVAAPLVERGMDVRIIDECITPDWRDEVARLLEREPPAAVGISAMTGEQLRFGLAFARFVRERSRAAIVWGGVHPSLLPEQTARHPLVDFVIAGEGEYAFAELVERLKRGQDTDGIPGVFRGCGGEVTGSPAEGFLDMAALPPVPYHLVDVEQYIRPRPELGASPLFRVVYQPRLSPPLRLLLHRIRPPEPVAAP